MFFILSLLVFVLLEVFLKAVLDSQNFKALFQYILLFDAVTFEFKLFLSLPFKIAVIFFLKIESILINSSLINLINGVSEKPFQSF